MLKKTICVISAIACLAYSSSAFAQHGGGGGGRDGGRGGNHRDGRGDGRGDFRPTPNRGGGGHGGNGLAMAADIVSIVANGMEILSYGGMFYRGTPAGYVAMPPPVGVVVPTLPVGCNVVYVNGVPYYSYASTCYVPTVGGYAVVAPPVMAPPVVVPQAAAPRW